MKSLRDTMMEHYKLVPKKGGINSPFNDAVGRAAEEIRQIDQRTGKEWTFSRWCGFLKGIPVHEIDRMLSVSRKADNRGKMFNWQVREYRKQVRENESKK